MWELANVLRIVIRDDMLSATGNGHRVKDGEEVEAQTFQKLLCGALLLWQFCPHIVSSLSLTEDVVDAAVGVKQFVDAVRMAFIG